MGDWISSTAAAEIIGVARETASRSLTDPALRTRWWGEEGRGWRLRPLVTRRIWEVSRARAEEIARNPRPI